jgi:hypothetical protein
MRILTSGLIYLKKQIYKLFLEIYAFLLLKILNLLYYLMHNSYINILKSIRIHVSLIDT